MAKLGAAAIKDPEFSEICTLKSAQINFVDPPESRRLNNHNRLLKSYSGAFGIKTGFTKKSGRCLVSAAQRDGVTLIAVTLNDPSDWEDHEKMLDYGFSQLRKTTLDDNVKDIRLKVTGAAEASISVRCALKPYASLFESDISHVTREIYLKKFEYAPVKTGELVGTAVYYIDGSKLCEVPIEAAESVKALYTPPEKNSNDKGFFGKIADFFKKLFNR